MQEEVENRTVTLTISGANRFAAWDSTPAGFTATRISLSAYNTCTMVLPFLLSIYFDDKNIFRIPCIF